MVETDQVANVQDMSDDLVERGVGGDVCGQTVLIAGVDAGDEVGRKVDHDDCVTRLDELENVILDVARVRADAERGAVAVDDRRLTTFPVLAPEDINLCLCAVRVVMNHFL